MKKSQKKPAAPSMSIRRAAQRFRFNKNRDDHNPGFDTERIFVPSPLMHGGDIGVSAAPVVILMGYAVVQTAHGLTSVQAQVGSRAVGRMVDLHPEELARLDSVAEIGGGDFHRFKADVHGAQSGHPFSVWVFQAREHATALDLETSAEALTEPTVKALKVSP